MTLQDTSRQATTPAFSDWFATLLATPEVLSEELGLLTWRRLVS